MPISQFSGRLQSERLLLRFPEPKQDAATVYRAVRANRGRLNTYLGCFNAIKSTQDVIAHLRGRTQPGKIRNSWLIFPQQQETFAGMIFADILHGNACNLWWWLTKEAEGHGYMTEAALTVREHVFAQGVERVYAECNTDNAKSLRLIQKLGLLPVQGSNMKKRDTIIKFVKTPDTAVLY